MVTIHELNSAKFGELLAVKFDELRQEPHASNSIREHASHQSISKTTVTRPCILDSPGSMGVTLSSARAAASFTFIIR